MIFVRPQSPWEEIFGDFEDRPARRRVRIGQPEKKEESKAIKEVNKIKVPDTLAYELSKLTQENTKVINWEDVGEWPEDTYQVYTKIVEECKAAARQGKHAYTYESTQPNEFLGQIVNRLSKVDGLNVSGFFGYGSVDIDESGKQNIEKKIKVVLSW